MKKTCAYCGQEGKMTKEHIWPKCIINRAPELIHRLIGSQMKVVAGELTIADVCAKCNNGKLSDLDAYLCGLYDIFFEKFIEDQASIDFSYDYVLLLRTFLKISYNSLRAFQKGENYLSKYKDFILNGGAAPNDISVIVELIPPYENNGTKIYPHSVRAGEVKLENLSDWVKIRLISLNSYYFYIIISDRALFRIPESELSTFYRWADKALISPTENKITIPVNKYSHSLDIHKDISSFSK